MSDALAGNGHRPAAEAAPLARVQRRHLALLGAVLLAVLAGLCYMYVQQLRAVGRLQAERIEQQRKLDAMERQAEALQKANLDAERSIERIERTLIPQKSGLPGAAPVKHAFVRRTVGSDAALAEHLQSLALASAGTQPQALRLRSLAGRGLNLRRLASIARGRMLAAIPSLNPVGGGINAAFGWRTDPFPEFHKGLDLAADYGTPVHASAAGIVVSAGWEGGFGNKVDIDHGNGYHTWYCHLSRIGVIAGQHVLKGERIAAAGSTGESTGPHLHYQVMHDGVAIDPLPFLNGVPANIMASLPPNPNVQ